MSESRGFLKIALYVLVFVTLPIIVTVWRANQAHMALMTTEEPAPFQQPPTMVQSPDPGKPVVAIVISNKGTEITDLLAPYAILSASDAFNVFIVAPRQEVSPLWGGVEVYPHFSFESFHETFPNGPDLIVVPFMQDHDNSVIVKWVKENAGTGTHVISICEGARTVAAAGLLKNRRATSHWSAIQMLEQVYPDTLWERNVRFVSDENLTTSGGVTAGIDATFHILEILAGQEIASRTAHEMGYKLRNLHFQAPKIGLPDILLLALSAAFTWDHTDIGVILYPGMDELYLTAILDTYPRTFSARTIALAPRREIIRSKHGINFVPKLELNEAPALDRILLPAGYPDSVKEDQSIQAWLEEEGMALESFEAIPVAQAFDQTLTDISNLKNVPISHTVAKMIEYPDEHIQQALQEDAKGWPFHLLLQPLALGLMSVAAVRLMTRKIRKNQRKEDSADKTA